MIRIIRHGEKPDELFSRYESVRRAAWVNYTNKASTDLKLRLHSTDPQIVADRQAFFDALNNDPAIHLKLATMMNEQVEDMFEAPNGV